MIIQIPSNLWSKCTSVCLLCLPSGYYTTHVSIFVSGGLQKGEVVNQWPPCSLAGISDDEGNGGKRKIRPSGTLYTREMYPLDWKLYFQNLNSIFRPSNDEKWISWKVFFPWLPWCEETVNNNLGLWEKTQLKNQNARQTHPWLSVSLF